MKLLWLTNVLLPKASILLNQKPTPYGGWLVSTASMLEMNNDIEFYVCAPSHTALSTIWVKDEHTTYIVIPPVQKEEDLVFEEIIQKIQPDIVHIFGTEYLHTFVMTKTLNRKNIPFLISLQGIVSIYEKHYYGGIPDKVIYRKTLRDILKNDSLPKQRDQFRLKAFYEVKSLEAAKHVTGRTKFDHDAALSINPKLTYHMLDESLRPSFYEHTWLYDSMTPYTLMTSQAHYPIKGVHFLLQALAIIKKAYPDVKLYITGEPIQQGDTIKSKIKQSSYAKYLMDLIHKNQLENHVFFLGPKNEQDMLKQYLKTHVFVIPSAIENSSNALAEAMILGMPCVSSNVGGSGDLLTHEKSGLLYTYDDINLLASSIKMLFSHQGLAESYGKNARLSALERHDLNKNFNRLMEIYQEIL